MTLTNDNGTEWSSDAIGALAEGTVLLPVQYFDRRAPRLRPEMRLMLAVLENAIATFLRYRHARVARQRRAFSEVRDWIDSDDTVSPFAFVRICDSVGLDAAYLRAGLARIASAPRHGSRPSWGNPFRRTAGARHAIGSR